MAQRSHTKRDHELEHPASPIAMLKADHQKVQALFDEYEAAGDRKSKAKQTIVEEVFAAEELNTKLEEEIFYPAVKAQGDKEGKKLIVESIEEHQVVKTLMEDMRDLDPGDEQYEAKFSVLIGECPPSHCGRRRRRCSRWRRRSWRTRWRRCWMRWWSASRSCKPPKG